MKWKKIGSAWIPKDKDEELIGIFLRSYIEEEGDYPGKRYVIETDKEVRVVFGSIVLNQGMDCIKDGENVKIKFLGKVKGDKNEYNNFEVSKGSE